MGMRLSPLTAAGRDSPCFLLTIQAGIMAFTDTEDPIVRRPIIHGLDYVADLAFARLVLSQIQ